MGSPSGFIMGNWASVPDIPKEIITKIQNETGFKKVQVEHLWKRFVVLDTDSKGYLTRKDFLDIHELQINPLGDRIVHAFFHDGSEADNFCRNKLQFEDFVKVLAHFRPIKKSEKDVERNKLNSRLDKLKFAFRMYDIDGDGLIKEEEVLSLLTTMVGHDHVSTEQLKSISKRTIHNTMPKTIWFLLLIFAKSWK